MVGNSHAVTLIHGSPGVAGDLPAGMSVSFIAKTDKRRWHVTASAAGFERHEWTGTVADVVSQANARHVFLLWRGNQLIIRGLLLDGPEFDVVLPSDAEPAEPTVRLIPCSALESYVRATLSGDDDLQQVLDASRRSGAHLWMLAPPPLLPDVAIRERLAQQPQFASRLEQLGLAADNVRLVPARVRLRLQGLLLGVYRAFAAEQGAGFIPAPAEAFDDAGMLREEYWGTDVTHPHPDYGAAYLRKLFDVALNGEASG